MNNHTIAALRNGIVELERLWPILFDDVYALYTDENRSPLEWHPVDHWFAIRTSLETRLAALEQAELAQMVQP